MANIPQNDTTTIYVHTESTNAELAFNAFTHYGNPDTLDTGVYLAAVIGETGVTVVDTERAEQFISDFNHAPGCSVIGYETH